MRRPQRETAILFRKVIQRAEQGKDDSSFGLLLLLAEEASSKSGGGKIEVPIRKLAPAKRQAQIPTILPSGRATSSSFCPVTPITRPGVFSPFEGFPRTRQDRVYLGTKFGGIAEGQLVHRQEMLGRTCRQDEKGSRPSTSQTMDDLE